MGLDIRLSVRKKGLNEFKTIYEGNGRIAYAFVREYVEWYGKEIANADMYGKDIHLENAAMVNDLIVSGASQLATEYNTSLDEMLSYIAFSAPEDLYGPIGFINILMSIAHRMNMSGIISQKNEDVHAPYDMEVFIEADW
jgi:fido (protein-threonine AMPylation protein)